MHFSQALNLNDFLQVLKETGSKLPTDSINPTWPCADFLLCCESRVQIVLKPWPQLCQQQVECSSITIVVGRTIMRTAPLLHRLCNPHTTPFLLRRTTFMSIKGKHQVNLEPRAIWISPICRG